jgi:hypothetical protein
LPELNDPLEGFKDLFWKGDVIVWKNLLRHYLLCFMPGAPFLARSLREKWEDWHSDTQHLEKNRKGASRLLGTDQSRANAKPFPDSISR